MSRSAEPVAHGPRLVWRTSTAPASREARATRRRGGRCGVHTPVHGRGARASAAATSEPGFPESRTRSGRRIFQAGVASPTYTDATLTVGVTVIKANHLKEDLHPEATASNPGGSRALLLALITEVPYTSSRPLARAEPVNKNETAGS